MKKEFELMEQFELYLERVSLKKENMSDIQYTEMKRCFMGVCMGLFLTKRLRVLFNGKVWVKLLTFNNPLTPSFHTTKKSDVLVTNKS